MNLASHERTARILFWFSQTLGMIVTGALLIFIGGSLISELIHKLIDFKEDYMVFVLLICEILLAFSFIISWYRKRQGSMLIILFSLLICILYWRETMSFVYLHLPVVFSGLLLLFYSYYKEWILKQKP